MKQLMLLSLLSALSLGACKLPEEEGLQCQDGFDNDGDGFTDCQDITCAYTDSCALPRCGDGALNQATEQCDAEDLGGASCDNLNLPPGELRCDDSCQFDISSCQGESCGDGQLDAGEECDGPNLNGLNCSDLGFDTGVLRCGAEDCLLDIGGCETVPRCGNGVLEGGEVCDSDDVGGVSCQDLGLGNGDVLCAADCSSIDTTACQGPVCGDGVVDRGQICYAPQVTFGVGGTPTGVVVVDLDGINGDDIVSSNFGDDTLTLLLNNGANGFSAATLPSGGQGPISLTRGDFDLLNGPDLAIANNANTAILFNNGLGAFGAPLLLSSAGGPFPITTGDLNNDGSEDVVLGIFGGGVINAFLNNGSGGFGPRQDLTGSGASSAVAIADLDGINGPDIVSTDRFGDSIAILLNQGGGAAFSTTTLVVGVTNDPLSLALGDMDNDGLIDIVVSNATTSTVRVLRNSGDGLNYTNLGSFPCGASPFVIALRDLDRDGSLDLLSAALSSNALGIALNNGDGTLGDLTLLTASDGIRSLDVGDLNGDGALDIATANQNANSVSVFFSTP